MTDKKDFYLKEPINRYLKDLSARTIVPGGGSASAVCAAIGTALNLMVINYTFKEGESLADSDMMIVAKAQQEETLERLSKLIDEDCRVFSELMEAIQKKEDAQKKYIAASKVPMKICHECHASMGIAAFISKSGNRNLISDVGCAGHTLRAAFDSARLNVEINLARIEDRSFVDQMQADLADLVEGFKSAEQEIEINVENVIQEGKKSA